MAHPATMHVGFLTVLQEGGGFVGGYLVTNNWGRPLEFRLSSAVQPNRLQQILYADTLRPYICSDLIGKTLVEKTATPPHLVLTDTEAALDLRLKLDVPVAWLASADDPRAAELSKAPHCALPGKGSRGPFLCHPRFPEDLAAVTEVLEHLTGVMDLGERFLCLREAISEARKSTGGARAA